MAVASWLDHRGTNVRVSLSHISPLFCCGKAPTSSRREKDDDDDISPDESNTTNNSNRNVLRGKSPTGLFLLSSPSVRPDRYVGTSTPTDFTADYKEGMPETSFDSSNVLAWLQSPTPNGFLFSPGFGSMLNTPNYNASSHTNTNNINHHQPSSSLSKQARSTSATPTPIVSTSFFFSDVAGLPKQPHTPAGTSSTGNSNIICISPLASKKQHNQNGQHYQQTPVDLKEIFASPVERKYRVMSTASNATMNKDAPSLDAVVLAERDLMEDEDLSVLLQLASNTTPRGNSVFRSTPRKHLRTTKSEENDNNLPGLQLPMIGGKSGSDNNDCPKARLSQKSTKCDDFAPPQLGMRSSSVTATATKEIYVGGTGDGNCSSSGMHQKNKDNGKKMLSKSSSIPIPGYSMYPPPDHSQYYQMLPPNIPPGMPTGSMHISLGGQPPSKSSKSSASGKSGTNSPPHPSSYSDYHNSAYGMPHMYAPYGVMGYPPYNSSHYPPPPPPPRHLSAYGTAQQSTVPPALGQKATTKSGSKSSESKSTVQTEKGGKKRSSIPGTDHCDSKTKKKKGSSSPTHPKRKNKSPQLTDHDERQKAADAIQNLNAASGGKNDKAAALAAAILRGVTMRPSGKWQAQLYFAGKSRYIGVFDTREKAALAYEIAREKLKSGHVPGQDGASTENLVNVARKAAFDGVNEQLTSK